MDDYATAGMMSVASEFPGSPPACTMGTGTVLGSEWSVVTCLLAAPAGISSEDDDVEGLEALRGTSF